MDWDLYLTSVLAGALFFLVFAYGVSWLTRTKNEDPSSGYSIRMWTAVILGFLVTSGAYFDGKRVGQTILSVVVACAWLTAWKVWRDIR